LLLHCRDVLQTDLRTAANPGEGLQLLLNLTSRITSSLDLREVVRAVAANIREVIDADAVGIGLPDAASRKFRIFAMDFPRGKGVVKEEVLVTPGAAYQKATDTLKPVVIDRWGPDELGPEIYDIAAAEGVKVACSIPLVNRGRFLGILSILRTTETLFIPEDAKMQRNAVEKLLQFYYSQSFPQRELPHTRYS
jgi:formate hydrogenlyase transcriptional activator